MTRARFVSFLCCRRRWPLDVFWLPQFLRTYNYVHILHAECIRTEDTEVPLVEEIPHDVTNGELALRFVPYSSKTNSPTKNVIKYLIFRCRFNL